EYAKVIATRGKEMFGNKFTPLLEFMPFENYLELLGQIDIAVFAHKRQQAMGNTITLLGLGKKVYMHSDVTPWAMFNELGVKVFDICKFDLMPLNDDVREKNQKRIKSHFSEITLAQQLQYIFEG
nr:TDP-N-acetylfucosamine:lipid II N-acetylfucosaminyltransferase [Halothiobacillus sp.]